MSATYFLMSPPYVVVWSKTIRLRMAVHKAHQRVPYARVWRMPKPKKDTGSSTGAQSGRLGRSDWIEAAFRALSVGGLGNLSVERLARELGATKGSFYWHFTDRPALVEAVLEEWER